MKLKNRIIPYIRNLSTYFGASLIPMVFSLATNPWIAKNMSPEDYAVSGYYLSFSTLISPIIIFYIIHYYIKEYFRLDEAGREKLYATIAKATIWFSGLVSVICFIGLYCYLKFINTTLEFPIMPYLAMMVFAIPVTGLFHLQLSQYRMEKKASAYFRLSVCSGVLNVLLSLVFVVWMKMGAFGKLLSPICCNFAVFLFLVYRFRKYLVMKTSFVDFRKIFVFCLPLALSATLGYFTNGFSTTYLESVGNTTEYGIYIVGNSIGMYLMIFGTAISNTFQPDIYETTVKKMWRKFTRLCCLQIGLTACVSVAFIAVAPMVISILTAGRYVSSAPYAQIVALSVVTANIYYLVNNFSIATNRPKLYLYTSIAGSALIVLGMPYAVDRWEYYGGCWMNVLSYLAFTLINIALLIVLPSKKESDESPVDN